MAYITKVYLDGLNIGTNGCNNSDLVDVFGIDYRGKEFHGTFNIKLTRPGQLEVKIISIVNNTDFSVVEPAEGKFEGNPYGIFVKTSKLVREKFEVNTKP